MTKVERKASNSAKKHKNRFDNIRDTESSLWE